MAEVFTGSVNSPSMPRCELPESLNITAMHRVYAATCDSVTVSGVGDLDGTYDLDASESYPYYFRAGGTTTYEVYQWTSNNNAWYIADASTDDGMRVSRAACCPTAEAAIVSPVSSIVR